MKKTCETTTMTTMTFTDWTRLMAEVHGRNGMVAIAWYLAVLYRDVISDCMRYPHKSIPFINFSGPAASGKSYLAYSIRAMFGKRQANFNFPYYSNKGAVAHCDEYNERSGRFPVTVNILKQAWDCNLGLILSAQKRPEDRKLQSRCIHLEFQSRRFSDSEARKGGELKTIEADGGLKYLSIEMLKHTKDVEDYFFGEYETIRKTLEARYEIASEFYPDIAIPHAFKMAIRNHSILHSICGIIFDKVSLGFDYSHLSDAILDNLHVSMKCENEHDSMPF